jgi:hypothetical protein
VVVAVVRVVVMGRVPAALAVNMAVVVVVLAPEVVVVQ